MLRYILCGLAMILAGSPSFATKPPPQSYIVLNYHDIPEYGSKSAPFDRMAVSARNFEAHLDWLAANGYHFISVQQVIDVHAGVAVLPDKAVMLTFDDGFESFYTRVFPILKARHIPAVEAVIGTWMLRTAKPDVPGKKPVLRWWQVREMQASGLVEIASHTETMHDEVDANPQGETHAAVTTRRYLASAKRYESDAEYTARLAKGMQRSAAFITAATGHHPRLLVWPFGEYNGPAVAAARRAGMPITLALSDGVNNAGADLSVINRLLVTDDPEVPAFAAMVINPRGDRAQRAIRINLDSVWNANPVIAERNAAAMIRRVQDSSASAVYVQAYADRAGTTAALYFPNRHLPMRVDLLSAIAERLKETTGAKIYAQMPAVLIDATPAARRWAGDIYEDLAKYVAIDGLVLCNERLSFSGRTAQGHTVSLADDSAALTARMRTYRPFIKTAVVMDAPALQSRRALRRLDQALPRYLRGYDYVIVNAATGRSGPRQLARLVGDMEQRNGSVDRIVFGLAMPSTRPHHRAQPALLRADLTAMLRSGARNIELQPSGHGMQGSRIGKLFGSAVVK